MPTVRIGPIIGLSTQPGPAAWVSGLIYGACLFYMLKRAKRGPFGPADWVTLARAILTGCVAVLIVDSGHRTVLVGIATVALVLDAVDGQVARRTNTTSSFGARFDMEVDAFLILVLSIEVARSLGLWVLAIGAMRYLFVFFSWVLPWMRAQLPPRYWRKVVAATQGIVLTAAISGVLPTWANELAVLAALAMLVESFARDIVWLWYHRNVESLRQRLRAALPTAMKTGDKVAVAALRATLSAIDNAESVDRPAETDRHLALEQIAVGVGAAEVPRRQLTEADVERIVRAELAEREAAAQAYEAAGRPEAAEPLRGQIRALMAIMSR